VSGGRAIGIMTALNGVSAVVGIAQTVMIAYFFGTSRTVEIFFAATAIQTSIIGLAQLGQLSDILLPQHHRLKHSLGQEQAFSAFAVMVNWMALLSLLAAAAMWFLAPALMRLRVPGFSPEDLALGAAVFRWIVPLLCLQIIMALLTTLANAEKWFGVPEAVQIGARVVGLVCLAALATRWGIWALVVGLILNTATAFIALGCVVWKLGYRHRFHLRHDHFHPLHVFRQLAVTFSYVGAVQLYAFAFDAALSMLPQGTLAVFKYVQGLSAKAWSSLMRPVGVVFFSYFSIAFAKGAADLAALARTALARTMAIWAIAFVLVATSSQYLLAALWGPRHFGIDELELAALLLTLLYAVGFLGGFSLITRKIGATLGMVQSMYVAGAASHVVSALFAWVVIPRYGVAGALATVVVVSIVTNLVYGLPLLLAQRTYLFWYDWRLTARWMLAIAIACGAGLGIAGSIPLTWTESRVEALVAGGLLAAFSVTVLLLGAYLMRIGEVVALAGFLYRMGARWTRGMISSG
jgi:putative peptidoglycan lipid II flippase